MGTVTELPPRVEVSDFAKALLQIEIEEQGLNEQSERLSREALEIMERAMENVRQLSQQQEAIIAKRIALTDAKMKMLTGKAGKARL